MPRSSPAADRHARRNIKTVAAAKVFKVVGKGAQGADDRVRVPARLVFDALALDRALAQQVLQVDGEFAHGGWGVCLQ